MRKLKIVVRYDHGYDDVPFSASHIRLLRPLGHPVNAEAFEVASGDGASCRGADVVIVDRHWRCDITPPVAEELVKQVRAAGACLIHSLDDNLLDVASTTPEQKAAVGLLAREADGLIVSTEPLKERLRGLNACIHVVPNAIDERLFAQAIGRPPGRSVGFGEASPVLRVGYMGTLTHDGDLVMVRDALRAVLGKRRGAVELVLVGGIGQPATLQAFGDLAVRTLPVKRRDVEYTRFVPWMIRQMHFDVGIAPLEDNEFTRCKSDLKFLDYGALGIPGIYSRVVPYQSSVRHLETGYLADNTTEAWQEALERLLDDAALREAMGTRAQHYVFSTRSLTLRAREWQAAIRGTWEKWRGSASRANRSTCFGPHPQPLSRKRARKGLVLGGSLAGYRRWAGALVHLLIEKRGRLLSLAAHPRRAAAAVRNHLAEGPPHE